MSGAAGRAIEWRGLSQASSRRTDVGRIAASAAEHRYWPTAKHLSLLALSLEPVGISDRFAIPLRTANAYSPHMIDPLADSTSNCPRCLEPMEATDDGWECIHCAVDAVTEGRL